MIQCIRLFQNKEKERLYYKCVKELGGGGIFFINVKYKYLGNFWEIFSLKRCYFEWNGLNMF